MRTASFAAAPAVCPWRPIHRCACPRIAARASWLAAGRMPSGSWELDAGSLGELLRYREDPLMPGEHGFVEPGSPTLERYGSALHATRGAWRLSSG
jgi:hypothetical protein